MVGEGEDEDGGNSTGGPFQPAAASYQRHTLCPRDGVPNKKVPFRPMASRGLGHTRNDPYDHDRSR
jgi:hypothetical protein